MANRSQGTSSYRMPAALLDAPNIDITLVARRSDNDDLAVNRG